MKTFLVTDLIAYTRGIQNQNLEPNLRSRRYYIKAEDRIHAVALARAIPFYKSKPTVLEALELEK